MFVIVCQPVEWQVGGLGTEELTTAAYPRTLRAACIIIEITMPLDSVTGKTIKVIIGPWISQTIPSSSEGMGNTPSERRTVDIYPYSGRYTDLGTCSLFKLK